jgi:formiminoglutamase
MWNAVPVQNYDTPRPDTTTVAKTISKYDGREDIEAFLERTSSEGVRYCLIGIPEDIGVRANYGRPGADQAWEALLKFFLPTPTNRFFDLSKICMLGSLDISELIKDSSALEREDLCDLVEALDEIVELALAPIFSNGLVPIVVGGGHNNALPLMRAASKISPDNQVSVINIDAHADFRALEGRHSGNPFSYADLDEILNRYAVLGLNEFANAEKMLTRLDRRGWRYITAGNLDLDKLSSLLDYILGDESAIGLELDLDVIGGMASSACNYCGLSFEETKKIFMQCNWALEQRLTYVHLPEGAPATRQDGTRLVGQTLAALILGLLMTQ